MKISRKKISDQKGQGVMEYVLLTALIGIFCLGIVKKFGGTLKKRLEQIDRKITTEIQIAP